jgi:hypothetical protein
MAYSGIIYDFQNPPTDPHFQLTLENLQVLLHKLKGKPIRIEHENKTVGTVVEAHFDGTRAHVRWDLENAASGWATEHLINKNEIKELSLKHILYSNGALEPIEVSLCKKGARPNTVIAKNNTGYLNADKNSVYSKKVVMASAEAAAAVPASVTAPEAEAAANIGATAVPESTQHHQRGDEPAAKKTRFETPVDLINTLSTQITDADTIQGVIDFLASQMETSISTNAELLQLKEAKALLEQAQVAHVDASKNVVKDIVEVLSNLYSQYAPNAQISDECKYKFAESLSSNPSAMEFARPLIVAASAIHKHAAAATAADSVKTLNSAKERIQELQNKLNNACAMRANYSAPVAPTVTPNWAPAVCAPTPMVEVAAHAHEHPAHHQFVLPPVLANLGKFGDSGANRVSKDMFTRKV